MCKMLQKIQDVNAVFIHILVAPVNVEKQRIEMKEQSLIVQAIFKKKKLYFTTHFCLAQIWLYMYFKQIGINRTPFN